MLAEVAARGRTAVAAVVEADAADLPFADASVDAVFAAGLLPHLQHPVAGLAELARVARPGARLAVFHPIGRAALAARHGSTPDPDDIRARHVLAPALADAGWRLQSLDDGDDRYLALALRTG
jgi:SAM-dependent methyltransferase